jgi:hypothetical protein
MAGDHQSSQWSSEQGRRHTIFRLGGWNGGIEHTPEQVLWNVVHGSNFIPWA